jgi:hypothetical protein
MLRTALLAVLAAAWLLPCSAMADSGIRRVPCGYLQVTVTTVQSLTIPAACNGVPSLAIIKAETQAVRYRDDGVAPTATVGQPVAVTDAPIQYEGTISALQFIAIVSLNSSGGDANTTDFGATPYAFTVPSGYTNW